MKKWIAFSMVVMLVLSLTACGGSAPAASSGSKVSQSTALQPAQGTEQTVPEQSGEKQDDFHALEVADEKRVSDLKITTMKMEKTVYAPGEEIVMTLEWTGTPDSSCWMGIVPAEIPHGDELVNDDADLDYIYLHEQVPGTFQFTTQLEPGMYTLRVNENDDGGAELAWCPFAVR